MNRIKDFFSGVERARERLLLFHVLINYCKLQMETDSWIENAANGLMGMQVE